ncbi:MAG: RnfABCDGE type electron transport complex subunit G [Fusobacteriaceae bacterium]
MFKNRYVNYGIVLLLIAFISALILAKINNMTSPIIAENTRRTIEQARKKVSPLAKTFDEANKINKKNIDFIPVKDESNKLIGYVVSSSEVGYAGPVYFVVGFDLNGKITGLDIVAHNETPGLGAKVIQDSWKKLWIGRDNTYEFDKTVDAFAGATITPNAVYLGVMNVLDIYEAEVKK